MRILHKLRFLRRLYRLINIKGRTCGRDLPIGIAKPSEEPPAAYACCLAGGHYGGIEHCLPWVYDDYWSMDALHLSPLRNVGFIRIIELDADTILVFRKCNDDTSAFRIMDYFLHLVDFVGISAIHPVSFEESRLTHSSPLTIA